MSENFKILAKYIKDMSSETPSTETYLFVKDNISKYQLGIKIDSKAIKKQLIEVNTNLRFEDKDNNKLKSYFEISYITIVKVDEKIKDKDVFRLGNIGHLSYYQINNCINYIVKEVRKMKSANI